MRVCRVFQKEIDMKRLSFITQFKIEFLLLFFSCRRVLGKIPTWLIGIKYPKQIILCDTNTVNITNNSNHNLSGITNPKKFHVGGWQNFEIVG